MATGPTRRRSPRCGPTLSQRALHAFLTFEAPDGKSPTWTYGEFDAVGVMATELVSTVVGQAHRSISPSQTRRRSLPCGSRRCASAVDRCRPIRWAERRVRRPHQAHRPCRVLWRRDRVDAYPQAAATCRFFIDEADAAFDWLPDERSPTGRLPQSRHGRSDVHERNDRAAKGGRDLRRPTTLCRQDHGRSREAHRRPPLVVSADCSTPTPSITRLPPRFGRRVGAPHAHVSRPAGSSAGGSPRATCAQLFARPRMILARGGPVDGFRLEHCWFAQNISERAIRHVSSIGSAAGPVSSTA